MLSHLSTFEEFWRTYPRKVGKLLAQRSWSRQRPDLDQVLSALAWQVRSRQWQQGFIPNPATYLNQGRWLDEPQGTASMPYEPTCCPICGHPEPRWHSAVECNTRFLAQQREATR